MNVVTVTLCAGSAVKSLTTAATDGSGRGQYALYVGGEDENYSALGRGTSLKQIMDMVRHMVTISSSITIVMCV